MIIHQPYVIRVTGENFTAERGDCPIDTTRHLVAGSYGFLNRETEPSTGLRKARIVADHIEGTDFFVERLP